MLARKACAVARLFLTRAEVYAGSAIIASIATITTAIISSISVKPREAAAACVAPRLLRAAVVLGVTLESVPARSRCQGKPVSAACGFTLVHRPADEASGRYEWY